MQLQILNPEKVVLPALLGPGAVGNICRPCLAPALPRAAAVSERREAGLAQDSVRQIREQQRLGSVPRLRVVDGRRRWLAVNSRWGGSPVCRPVRDHEKALCVERGLGGFGPSDDVRHVLGVGAVAGVQLDPAAVPAHASAPEVVRKAVVVERVVAS